MKLLMPMQIFSQIKMRKIAQFNDVKFFKKIVSQNWIFQA